MPQINTQTAYPGLWTFFWLLWSCFKHAMGLGVLPDDGTGLSLQNLQISGPRRTFPFLSLPNELRLNIYRFLLVDAATTLCPQERMRLPLSSGKSESLRRRQKSGFGILFVNREIHEQAKTVLYTENWVQYFKYAGQPTKFIDLPNDIFEMLQRVHVKSNNPYIMELCCPSLIHDKYTGACVLPEIADGVSIEICRHQWFGQALQHFGVTINLFKQFDAPPIPFYIINIERALKALRVTKSITIVVMFELDAEFQLLNEEEAMTAPQFRNRLTGMASAIATAKGWNWGFSELSDGDFRFKWTWVLYL